MADILLIHGSCHGAWCWRALIPALAALGHDARAIDLPSHGDDPTPMAEVKLDRYASAVLDALAPETILVGHSAGGMAISRAADLDPGRIARLVYLCAYLPLPGHSLIDMRKRAPRQPILKALAKSADGSSFSIIPEAAREVFYHDCSDADLAFALERVGPQPIAPQAEAVTLGARWAAVPKSYILCTDDSAVPVELQREMAASVPEADRHEMAGSHSPFFADPEGLAAILDRIAEV